MSSSSSSSSSALIPPVYPPEPPFLDGGDTQDASGASEEGTSDESIRYATGRLQFEQEDLFCEGFGEDWGHTLSYTNKLLNKGGGNNGNNWFVKEIPQLYSEPSGDACGIGSINQPLWFSKTGSGAGGKPLYAPKFSLNVRLNRRSQGDDSLGDFRNRRMLFHGGSGSMKGKFKGFIDPKGNETLATYHGGGKLASFVRGSGGQTAGYHYDDYPTGVNGGQLKHATYKVGSSNARRSAYNYCGVSEAGGSVNDLKTSAVEIYDAVIFISLVKATTTVSHSSSRGSKTIPSGPSK